MTRPGRGALAGSTLVVVAILAGLAWWIVARARPHSIGPRFADALLARRPGTTIDAWTDGVMRIALPSGIYIDVRLYEVFDACRTDRLGCSASIDRALGDVDRAAQATRDPERAMLRPTIVGDPNTGAQLGFVARPLIGSLEVRYVLVNGVTSTFVTSTIADRLGLARSALDELARATLRAEAGAALEKIDAGPVWRVVGVDEPVASLLDRDRMQRFADRLGTRKLYAVAPSRGSLFVAPAGPTEGHALVALLGAARSGNAGLLAYDVDAPDGAALATVANP